MKIAINSGLGDMVHFLPFAVELSRKGPLTIIGNKYSAEVCAMAGLENVTHDTVHTVLIPPPDAAIARIKRYGGNGTYRELYASVTGCAGDKAAAVEALKIEPPAESDFAVRILLCDMPRPNGLGSRLYTPDPAEFAHEVFRVENQFDQVLPLKPLPTMLDLFEAAAYTSAGIGQIGFLTALCQLFERPFYAVRAAGETDEKFIARKKVVHL